MKLYVVSELDRLMKEVFGESFLSYFDTPWKAVGWAVLIFIVFLGRYGGIWFIKDWHEYQGHKAENIPMKYSFTQYSRNTPSTWRSNRRAGKRLQRFVYRYDILPVWTIICSSTWFASASYKDGQMFLLKGLRWCDVGDAWWAQFSKPFINSC